MSPADRRPIVCDVATCAGDLATVEALARLALEARRLGLELHLVRPSSELRALIALAGLDCALVVEAGRESEERKEARRVEEEGELGEAPA
ncbi:MAG: hypothetical protein ABSC56_04750 [Solirubrobacteraceae bacterium]|jgi:hypothetical protein